MNYERVFKQYFFAAFFLIFVAAFFVMPTDAAATDDHSDTYLGATSVEVNSTVDGDLEVGEDLDYFSFEAVSGTSYIIETELITLDDSVMSLYYTDGITFLTSDDDGGEGLAAKLEWTCGFSGTYYVKVYGYWLISTGRYKLTISCSDNCGDLDIHKDDSSEATYLSVGSSTSGTVNSSTDQDWFIFPAIADSTYTLEVSLLTLTDSFLELYDIDGSSLITSDSDGGVGRGSKIVWTCEYSGMYYANVVGNTDSIGTYSFYITRPIPDDDGTITAGGGGSSSGAGCFIATASYADSANPNTFKRFINKIYELFE